MRSWSGIPGNLESWSQAFYVNGPLPAYVLFRWHLRLGYSNLIVSLVFVNQIQMFLRLSSKDQLIYVLGKLVEFTSHKLLVKWEIACTCVLLPWVHTCFRVELLHKVANVAVSSFVWCQWKGRQTKSITEDYEKGPQTTTCCYCKVRQRKLPKRTI